MTLACQVHITIDCPEHCFKVYKIKAAVFELPSHHLIQAEYGLNLHTTPTQLSLAAYSTHHR